MYDLYDITQNDSTTKRERSTMAKKRLLFLTTILFMLFFFSACSDSDTSTATSHQSSTIEQTDKGSVKSQSDVPESNSETEEIEEETEKERDVTHEGEEDVEKSIDDVTEHESEDDSAQQSYKKEYQAKLNETKQEMDALEPTDSSTYALKHVVSTRFEEWDNLLNEIYGVLNEQLPAEEMEELRQEQREWIDYRDKTAKEASLKYEGGTLEHAEYTSTLARLTEERSFELVREYME